MRLKELREDHDYTQKYIALLLHCKQNTYSQYENSIRPIPIPALIILSDLYNTSIDYILGITDEITPYPKRKKSFKLF